MKNFISGILGSLVAPFPKFILSLRYFKWAKKKINWENPKDLQQLIFKNYIDKYKNKDLKQYADLTDKIKVREFVAERIGEKYLTKLYGNWKDPEDIDFKSLPNKFVLKTNNGCGTNIIVKDRQRDLNESDFRSKLKKWLNFPYGDLTGQPHYSLIDPQILAEEYLVQNKYQEILPYDYKIFCFNGEPKFILYYEDRKVNGHLAKNMVYDVNWNPMNEFVKTPTNHIVEKPSALEEMLDIARKLSKGFEIVRVDLYEIDGKPIFGEMTFTPDVNTYFKKEFLDIKNFSKPES